MKLKLKDKVIVGGGFGIRGIDAEVIKIDGNKIKIKPLADNSIVLDEYSIEKNIFKEKKPVKKGVIYEFQKRRQGYI